MKNIIVFFSQGWIGSTLGLAGIILASYYFVKSKRKARIAFQYDHVMLVGGRGSVFPAEIEIRFERTVVPRVTASKIVVWNSGNATINGSDIVSTDPLRIEVPDGERILKYSILRQSREVNGWSITQPSTNSINLNFDYLDPRDGITIEVIHTVPSVNFYVVGTVKGMPHGILNYGRTVWAAYNRRGIRPIPFRFAKASIWTAFIAGMLMVIYGVFRPQIMTRYPELYKDIGNFDGVYWPLIIAGLVYAFLPLYLLWKRRRRYPVTLEPIEEESIDETHESK